MTPAFITFPKIGRWANSKICLTEKIDGTNASIDIRFEPPNPVTVGELSTSSTDPTVLGAWDEQDAAAFGLACPEGEYIVMRAGSRNRWLTRSADNYGFAAWVQENRNSLVRFGIGQHFGEWWGSGIQRGYGLEPGDKRFSLFNVGRWVATPNGVYDKGNQNPEKLPIAAPGLGVVPQLHYGPLRDNSGACQIEQHMKRLKFAGSQAAPGFKDPEGVMIYFESLKTYSKAPFDPNPKGQS